jgi:hypothetical protein
MGDDGCLHRHDLAATQRVLTITAESPGGGALDQLVATESEVLGDILSNLSVP